MFTGEIDSIGPYTLTPLDLGSLTIPAGTPMGGSILPVQAFLVAHPEGALLFDTGLGAENARFDDRLGPVRRSLVDALADLGLASRDVVAVVNCHLHYDHCGGNPMFPGTPIFVQSRDYRSLPHLDFAIPERVDFSGADLHILDGEAQILPGIRAVPTPGHTPGHQSLVVDDSEGAVVLAGQAAYTVAEFIDQEAEPARGARTAWDDGEFLQSIAYIKSLKPRCVYFSHDSGVWRPPAA